MRAETILVVDDEKLLRWAVRTELERDGFTVLEAESVQTAISIVREREPDLVLLDQLMADGFGLEVLELLKDKFPQISTIMLSAVDRADTAVQAMKLGAFDYITKPIKYEILRVVIERCLEVSRLRRRFSVSLKAGQCKDKFCGIVGTSEPIKDVFRSIERVAQVPATTVLVTGESGTGKELVAKAVHKLSARHDEAMMTVNCAAIPHTLIESELFGHEKGAFTDARSQKKGLFELAHKGTVFLDEIGDLPDMLQAILLRVLEQKTFRRVGGSADITVDVRIIAATNQDLDQKVRDGSFRADLFYRLNVVHIHMPPLRERRGDVILLAEYFLNDFNKTFRKNFKGLTEETKMKFLQHDWPGNVRELRNIVERAALMDEGDYIFSHDIELGHLHKVHYFGSENAAAHVTDSTTSPTGSLEDIEKAAIMHALKEANNNQSKAARILKISRDTLRYRMKKFGM